MYIWIYLSLTVHMCINRSYWKQFNNIGLVHITIVIRRFQPIHFDSTSIILLSHSVFLRCSIIYSKFYFSFAYFTIETEKCKCIELFMFRSRILISSEVFFPVFCVSVYFSLFSRPLSLSGCVVQVQIIQSINNCNFMMNLNLFTLSSIFQW